MRRENHPFEHVFQMRSEPLLPKKAIAAGLALVLLWLVLVLALIGGSVWVVIWVLRTTGVIA